MNEDDNSSEQILKDIIDIIREADLSTMGINDVLKGIMKAKKEFDQKDKAKMIQQVQINLLSKFAKSMLKENNPFIIGDVIKQRKIGDSYNYDFPTDGDVAVVMEIFPDEFTQVKREAGNPWTKENMLIACITEHSENNPDIRVYNVDWRYFEHV